MSKNNKIKVNGRNGQSTRPLSSDHITSLDFNVVKPIGIYEMIPGDTIHISPEIWMRTQALAAPTFGKVDVITRAFFVPHRLAFTHFIDFWRQQTYRTTGSTYGSVPGRCMQYMMHSLSFLLLDRFKVVDSESDFTTHKVPMETIDGNAHRFTFGLSYEDSSYSHDYADFNRTVGAATIHFRFNPLGKRVYDLFLSLGYRFQFNSLSDSTHGTHDQGTSDNDYPVTLMPILSWLKIFSDWYCPSEYRDLFNVEALANHDFLSQSDAQDILDMCTWACYIFYNDDIFSLAEKTPFSKQQYINDSLFGQSFAQQNGNANDLVNWDKSFKVTTDRRTGALVSGFGGSVQGSRTALDLDGKPFLGASYNGSTTGVYTYDDPRNYSDPLNNLVSAWTVRAVVKAATWLQRNNLLSKRATDYLHAKFGVTPSADRLNIAEYVGSASKPLQIGDVVSTEATGDKLGQLGGKGTAYSIDKLTYHAQEFGYFIVSVELRPRIEYGQGVNPLVLRTRPTDFYQQECDGLGFTPVPTQCLVGGPQTGLQPWNIGETYNLASIENRIFGYLPTYWDYKISHGNLSGDFGIPNNIDIQAFHLFRNVGGSVLTEYAQNSLSFRYPGLCYYDNHFNRIFVDDSTIHLKDHFHLIASFECNITGEMLALNESWMVNDEHDERKGVTTEIQSVL